MIKVEVHSTRAVIRAQEPLTVGLRGAKARFVFGADWEGLIKTAVFRQGEKTVTLADVGEEVIIPWEVLTLPGVPVLIGVYGTDDTEAMAIPTLWTQTDPVRPGADPKGDPSTEPTPGLWEQLQGKLGSLEQLDTKEQSSLVAAINEANRAVFAVSVSGTEDLYQLEQPIAELIAAYHAGKMVLCLWEEHNIMLPISRIQERANGISFADFYLTVRNREYHIHMTFLAGDEPSVQGSVTMLATEESKLPNPKKLTLIGDEKTEYDGSEEVSIEIPTKVSQLQNDSGFLTEAPVNSVNGQTGDVHFTIPSVVSQLANDKGYLTEAPVTSVNGQTGDVTVPAAVKVTVEQNGDGSYEADLKPAQIVSAYNAGSVVCCRYKQMVLLMVYQSLARCIFSGVYDGSLYTVSVESKAVTVSDTPLASESTGGSIPKITMQETDTNASLEPNKFYVFPTMERLDLSLEGGEEDVLQEYRFQFESGSPATVLSLPEDIVSTIGIPQNSIVQAKIVENILSGVVYEKTPSALLPSGYEELSYIENPDKAYINTGIPAGTNVGVYVDYTPLSAGSIFGAIERQAVGYFGMSYSSTNFSQIYWHDGAVGDTLPGSLGTAYKVNYNYLADRVVTVNGTFLADLNPAKEITSNNIYLFRLNAGTTGLDQAIKAQLREVKITVDDRIVRHFIPARETQSETIGLFDLISGTFFASANSTVFIGG